VVSNDLTFSGLPSELLFFGRTFSLAGGEFTYGVVLMFVMYAIAWYALSQTAWGRHVYAVGDNPEAARLTGINTNRVLFSVYTLAGLTSGIAAMLLVARTELGDPNAGQTTENLDSITAVVLGGTSLFGGRGTVIGTLIGATIVGVFRNGLTLIGVEVIWQYFVTGILVILAVSVDQLTHRRRA
jgi:fructose transport system permease protein